MSKLLPLLVLLMTSAALQPASAEDISGFTTPSGNISCYYSPTGEFLYSPEAKSFTCEIQDTQWQPAKPEPSNDDCDTDRGKQVAMKETTKAEGSWWCRGDTWLNETIKVLPYGQTWQSHGFSCLSEQTGLTCTNKAGHGWTVSKRSVQLR